MADGFKPYGEKEEGALDDSMTNMVSTQSHRYYGRNAIEYLWLIKITKKIAGIIDDTLKASIDAHYKITA